MDISDELIHLMMNNHGSDAQVLDLLKKVREGNATITSELSPLIFALMNGSGLEVIKSLVELRPCIDFGNTYLHYVAIACRYYPVNEPLMEYLTMADINTQDYRGLLPIHWIDYILGHNRDNMAEFPPPVYALDAIKWFVLHGSKWDDRVTMYMSEEDSKEFAVFVEAVGLR